MKKGQFAFFSFLVALLIVPLSEAAWGHPASSSQAATVAAINADDQFGVVWINPPGQTAGEKRLQQAVDLGARWDRFPFYWDQMQPSADRGLDFGTMDAVVASDLGRGIKVQGILLGAPSWAYQDGKISSTRWRDFVSQTVQHYRDRVQYWEIWNEPDLLDGNGNGIFWQHSIDDYFELLRTGYTAVKVANPNAKVLLSGLSFPYNNQEFLPKLLAVIAKDPAAKANGFYFDILPLHLYGRAAPVYDLPLGYIGEPDFPGFRNMLAAYGLAKPIWVNETGVPVWDTESGKNAPGRATRDEQASYIIQAFAYGRAAGVDKLFVHQLYDDGAGAIDPQSKLPAEFFGLISNAGEPRPAYTAYQVAATYFSNAKLATRVNIDRSGSPLIKGWEMITLYGTPQGKVTVLWNSDAGGTKTVRIPAATTKAVLMDKLGKQSPLTATDGSYAVNLAPATNNNNFDCYTTKGCQPDDYILGGQPLILLEDDKRVPPVTINALQSGVIAPFAVTWRTTRDLGPVVTFDVQFMDPTEGRWRDWLLNTTATSAVFGEGVTGAQKNHTYLFRVRAWQGGKLVDSYGYTAGGTASTVVLGGKTVENPPGQILLPPNLDGRIEIVWPQENKPVSQATKVNIGAYLFRHQTSQSIGLSWEGKVKLWRALNNGVEEEVTTGTKRLTMAGTLRFPMWDFNDVDVGQATDPVNKYYFRLGVEGALASSSVWSHGADARTYFPKTDTPARVLTATPPALDAKIEVVWPQGGLPVEQAAKVNVSAYLFGHGTLDAVSTVFTPTVKLWRALNNGTLEEVGRGEKATKFESGLTFPVWYFNNVDVSEAKDNINKYYFRLTVDGVPVFSNIWSHGKDARTYFPQADVPTGVDE